jgi:hypothetical protein
MNDGKTKSSSRREPERANRTYHKKTKSDQCCVREKQQKKKTIQSLNLAQGAAHRDAREWKKGKSGNHLRGDNHCARTAQQNQNFRSRENKEENQKGHRQDLNKSFLLKFNKITLNS